MLLRLVVQNFLSFDGEAQFDMFPNPKRANLRSHIYTDYGDVPILKQSAIYGPNAAGKSNIVNALWFVKNFVVDKEYLNRVDLPNYHFLLRNGSEKEPIRIGVEIEVSKKYYLYEIEILPNIVARETLSEMFPMENRSELVFERVKNKIQYANNVSVNKEIKDATISMLTKNPKSSVVALNRSFPIIADARCNTLYEWFNSKLEIIGLRTVLPTLINILREDEQMLDFSKKLISRLEIGIDNFNIEESDFDQWAREHVRLANQIPNDMGPQDSFAFNSDAAPVFSIGIENGVRKVYQLIFENIGANGFVGHLDPRLQSDGTLRAFTLLPALYFASKKGKIVVVDEINNCLSPSMVKGIVEFYAKTDDTNGQLIFTTHDTQLLDEEDILRSDEIWFVDKKNGSSILYSHNDFKNHTISTYRGYNEGRYGAIRYVRLWRGDDK